MNEHEKRMCLGLEGEALDRALETALNKTKRDVKVFSAQLDDFSLEARCRALAEMEMLEEKELFHNDLPTL